MNGRDLYGGCEWLSQLVVAICLPTVLTAAESEPNDAKAPEAKEGTNEKSGLWERDQLTGRWGGFRDTLSAQGIDLGFSYTAEVMGNLSGGVRSGSVYNGLATLTLTLDTDKLTHGGWKGGTFYASSLWTHGRSATDKLLGDTLTASNIDAFDSIRMFELWVQQTLLEGKLSIRAGSLAADSEFAGTTYGGFFLNSAFGWPAFISGNVINTGPAFYVTAPGVRVRLDLSSQWYVQGALYDGDPFDSATGDPHITSDGLHFHLGSSQGYLSIGELGFKLNQGEKAEGLPGTYKVGGWFHSGDFADNYLDVNGASFALSGLAPMNHSGNFGLYASAEQMVLREGPGPDGKPSDQGLGLFVRAGGSPRDRSAFEFVLDGGLNYKGLFPGRGDDVLGLGVVYARVSRDLRHQLSDAGTTGVDLPDHEIVVEAGYRLVLTPWFNFQPTVQWIHHPGTSGTLPDAFMLGARSNVTF